MPRHRSGSFSTTLVTPKEYYAEYFRHVFLERFKRADREGDWDLSNGQFTELRRRTGIDDELQKRLIRKSENARGDDKGYMYLKQRPPFNVLEKLAKYLGDVVVDENRWPIEWIDIPADYYPKGDPRRDLPPHYAKEDHEYRVTLLDFISQFPTWYRTLKKLSSDLRQISMDNDEREFVLYALDIAQRPRIHRLPDGSTRDEGFISRSSKYLNKAVKLLVSSTDLPIMGNTISSYISTFFFDPDPFGPYDALIDRLNAEWPTEQN